MAAAKRKADRGNELRIASVEGKTDEQRLAETSLDPTVSAAGTVLAFNASWFGKTGLTETVEALRQSVRKVRNGDLAGPEAMLVTQADSLNAIFTELARRAALNMGEYINASERYMRLALKAQAQCRATIETLAAMKNPPVVFARQANISNGPQQVNNGELAPRAEKSDNPPNELLEHHVEPRVDFGAPETPVGGNQELVPLETIDRAA